MIGHVLSCHVRMILKNILTYIRRLIMNLPIIDAHIHIDKYEDHERARILRDMNAFNVTALIAVSWDLASSKHNKMLASYFDAIKPAFGFHPEQPLLSDAELTALLDFITESQRDMIAIGEVGLPYYMRRKNPSLDRQPYIEQLEPFIQTANHLDMPIIMHAIYDDAPIVCDVLEKHSVKKAHFHWFKGDKPMMERLIANEYFISITPDVLYEQEIQDVVAYYPLQLMMVETDGPWSFSGPFSDEMTHPKMIHHAINKIATIKNMDLKTVYHKLYENTKQFYCI